MERDGATQRSNEHIIYLPWLKHTQNAVQLNSRRKTSPPGDALEFAGFNSTVRFKLANKRRGHYWRPVRGDSVVGRWWEWVGYLLTRNTRLTTKLTTSIQNVTGEVPAFDKAKRSKDSSRHITIVKTICKDIFITQHEQPPLLESRWDNWAIPELLVVVHSMINFG